MRFPSDRAAELSLVPARRDAPASQDDYLAVDDKAHDGAVGLETDEPVRLVPDDVRRPVGVERLYLLEFRTLRVLELVKVFFVVIGCGLSPKFFPPFAVPRGFPPVLPGNPSWTR